MKQCCIKYNSNPGHLETYKCYPWMSSRIPFKEITVHVHLLMRTNSAYPNSVTQVAVNIASDPTNQLT
jgi:hypothetical protein